MVTAVGHVVMGTVIGHVVTGTAISRVTRPWQLKGTFSMTSGADVCLPPEPSDSDGGCE